MEEGRVNSRYDLLIIGGSAGSLEVIIRLVPLLKPDLNLAIVLVMHRKSGDSMLVELLSDKTKWQVKEAEEKEPILPGTIYIAPADYHLLIEKTKSFSLDFSEKLHYSRPGIDASFETAADAYGPKLAALLLSGANGDGAAGLKKIKEEGGLTLVQDPSEASVSYMPQQAIDLFPVDAILTFSNMADRINNLNR